MDMAYHGFASGHFEVDAYSVRCIDTCDFGKVYYDLNVKILWIL